MIHTLSMNLTPTLSCEPKFCMFIINDYYTKRKHLQSLVSLLKDVVISRALCDSWTFNLTRGFFISLFIVTGRAIFTCSTALLYLMIIRCCLLHMVSLYIFSKNFNFDDSGISFPAFPSTTNLKLQNIPVTPKKVEKFIIDLDFSKKSQWWFWRIVNLNFHTY